MNFILLSRLGCLTFVLTCHQFMQIYRDSVFQLIENQLNFITTLGDFFINTFNQQGFINLTKSDCKIHEQLWAFYSSKKPCFMDFTKIYFKIDNNMKLLLNQHFRMISGSRDTQKLHFKMHSNRKQVLLLLYFFIKSSLGEKHNRLLKKTTLTKPQIMHGNTLSNIRYK